MNFLSKPSIAAIAVVFFLGYIGYHITSILEVQVSDVRAKQIAALKQA